VKKLSVKVRLFLVLVLAPGLAAAQEGQWLVAPYLWTADVSWDLEARGSGGVAFSDLVDKLDGAALIRIEYVRNKIGFTIDYVNMSLSDRTNISTPGPIPIDINIKAGVDLTVFEAGVFYRPSATDSGHRQVFQQNGLIRVKDSPIFILAPATCIGLLSHGISRYEVTMDSVVLMARST